MHKHKIYFINDLYCDVQHYVLFLSIAYIYVGTRFEFMQKVKFVFQFQYIQILLKILRIKYATKEILDTTEYIFLVTLIFYKNSSLLRFLIKNLVFSSFFFFFKKRCHLFRDKPFASIRAFVPLSIRTAEAERFWSHDL